MCCDSFNTTALCSEIKVNKLFSCVYAPACKCIFMCMYVCTPEFASIRAHFCLCLYAKEDPFGLRVYVMVPVCDCVSYIYFIVHLKFYAYLLCIYISKNLFSLYTGIFCEGT